ncbi:MAG TPA: tetratricopeptide repeat protein [Candidatus Sulfotelmatobacter sp.]|jgi:Tfp pilus assembly protein PilF|nr:tetratricopeptide repeat protein [Candidatus Sulfotelmatobacter sp.]
MAAHSQPLTPKKRLDSWKEIAAFFGRDERTVKRWEKERALPVYRVPGSARGGVFAYAEELAEWLKAPNVPWEAEVATVNPASDESGARIPSVDLTPSRVAADLPPSRRGPTSPTFDLQPSPTTWKVSAAKPFLWLVPLALIVGSFLVFSFSHREPRYKNALAAPHVPSAEAQDLYLKGRYYFEKRTPDDLNKAVDCFTQAIVHDPAYPAPYVGLADTYNLLREYSAMLPQEAFPRALAAARKAVELDPNSAEAHNSLAFASFWGSFDAVTADREFRRAIELDPTLPRAHHWYATFLVEIRRNSEALAEIERARQLNPSSTPILADKGFILVEVGKTEEARALLTQLTASQPDFIHPHRYLADLIDFPEGDYAGYFKEKRIVARLRHDSTAAKNIDAEEKGYNGGGLRGLLEARLRTAQDLYDRGFGSPFDVASAHAALGENDEGLKFLDIAYQRHDLALVTLPIDKAFQSLHEDEKFRDLVAKIGLPAIN